MISRLGDLGIENSNMEDILENIDTNNTNLQQLFDTMTRDVQIIKKDCGQTKIDLEVTKIQSDKKNFDELMNLVNTDLRTLKTLIQNT
ncbi:hypothetical protein HC766_02620 [Candidatus Gracilibacteria bacterium]|nr:hypothetical protein [Candidatus Gracilibacteria bacterium]